MALSARVVCNSTGGKQDFDDVARSSALPCGHKIYPASFAAAECVDSVSIPAISRRSDAILQGGRACLSAIVSSQAAPISELP